MCTFSPQQLTQDSRYNPTHIPHVRASSSRRVANQASLTYVASQTHCQSSFYATATLRRRGSNCVLYNICLQLRLVIHRCRLEAQRSTTDKRKKLHHELATVVGWIWSRPSFHRTWEHNFRWCFRYVGAYVHDRVITCMLGKPVVSCLSHNSARRPLIKFQYCILGRQQITRFY